MGIVNSSRAATYHFEVGPTTEYGFETAERVSLIGFPVLVWATVYGLSPSTTYHFRVVVATDQGETHGPDRSFTTLAAASPLPATQLTETPPPPSAEPAPNTLLSVPDLSPPLVTTGASATLADGAAELAGTAPVLLPEQSKTVVAEPVSGSVLVRSPGSQSFAAFEAADDIRVGSVVDARRGVVQISAAIGSGVDTGRFWGAVFRVSQPAGEHGITELELLGGRPARCDRKAPQRAAAAKRGTGGLWGKDNKGRFRTRGRNSVATVRGTTWNVAERCAGTLTRVLEGAVEVRDPRRGKTVLLKAGQQLMVRDPARTTAARRR